MKDLGVVLDSGLTVCDHIHSVCSSAYLELRRISSIRPFPTVEAAAELARSRIQSRSDNCNSLQTGITSEQIARLQKIQSHDARLTDWSSLRKVMTMPHLSWGNSIDSLFPNALSSDWQLLQSVILMVHYHLTSPAVWSRTKTSRSLCSSPKKKSDRPKGQSEKCWCTILSIPGSASLEFTTTENLPLRVFVVF